MTRYRMLAIVAAVACAAVGVASTQGATRADFARKCSDAWTGSRTTPAFRVYRTKCVNAAIAATSAATDAGNPTSTVANRVRARTACAARFPAPRNTPAKRAAYSSCVAAVTASQRAFAGRPLAAVLNGSNEVPAVANGPTGSALIRLNLGQRRICFTITVSAPGADPAVAAHIHSGVAGQNGPVVIPFSNTDVAALNQYPYQTKGCLQNIAAATINHIRQHPEGFYVNVHTTNHAGGATRGQLSK